MDEIEDGPHIDIKNIDDMTIDEMREEMKKMEDALIRIYMMSTATPLHKSKGICANCGHVEKEI